MKKKLIFITEALWIGGIETALLNLLNKIDYDKYEVTVLICRAELDLMDRVNKNCRILIVDRDKIYTAQKKYSYNKLFHLIEETDHPSILHKAMMWTVPMIRWLENSLYIKYVQSVMKDEKYDTAIIYSDRVAEIAVRVVKADKYLMFYHNALLEKRYHDDIAYNKCDKIIAVSQSKADELKKFRPRYEKKIIAINNLVDIDSIIRKSKDKQHIRFSDNNFNLVTCGRLAHQKAIDWAIMACRQLLDYGYKDLQWWIVGGGPDEDILSQQIKNTGIEEHFHLLGMQNNPYPYIANADLYVQPSRYENYSVVILEAMVLQKPILATIPAAKEQIVSGENGMLCEADPGKIAEGIEYLYKHEEERKKYVRFLSENSLEQANTEIMRQFYQLF